MKEIDITTKTDAELKEIVSAWNGDESGIEEDMAHEAEDELKRREDKLVEYYKGLNARGYTRTKEMATDLMTNSEQDDWIE